ncbi:substrate-binding domain-containing protein [Aquisphaera insulae]|uniref:substrate-binding domain-containing protein n=1 Tax=Aquisphaera insulae TaxID=2712864 RepID=UPI0013EA923E|nr:substrate-binding domain-containing protein [Aquisphaera insulae]
MIGLLDGRASCRAARGKGGLNGLAGLVVAALAASTAGCDSGSFLPPPPAELSPSDNSTRPGVTAAAKPLVVVESRHHSDEDSALLKAIARSQGGGEGVRVEIIAAGGEGKPEALLNEAVARKPLSILLDVSEPPSAALSAAISSARGKGIPVILVGLPAEIRIEPAGSATSAGSTLAPLVQVVPESLDAVTAKLVDKALANAKNARYKPEAGAIILVDPSCDPLAMARAKAFRDALAKAGVTKVEEVRYEGESKDAQEKLNQALKAHPEIRIVLATEAKAESAAVGSLGDQGDRGLYVIAGFAGSDSGANMTQVGDVAAMAVFSRERLLRKAVVVAVATARGQAAPRVELLIPIHLSPSNSGMPRAFRGYTDPSKAHSTARE